MSGRHREGGPGITLRALAGTVPVLGVAGAATGLLLGSGAGAPEVTDGGATTDEAVAPAVARTADETTPPPPSVRHEVPGRADQAVSAVAAATDAAREQGAVDRAREQRSVTAVVEDIRADARSRDAAAQQQGRSELDAFRDQQSRQQQAREQEQQAAQQGDQGLGDPGQCDLSGMPRLSPFADSDEIVNRDCGMTDDLGGERSQDPWIDGQLLSDDEDLSDY